MGTTVDLIMAQGGPDLFALIAAAWSSVMAGQVPAEDVLKLLISKASRSLSSTHGHGHHVLILNDGVMPNSCTHLAQCSGSDRDVNLPNKSRHLHLR